MARAISGALALRSRHRMLRAAGDRNAAMLDDPFEESEITMLDDLFEESDVTMLDEFHEEPLVLVNHLCIVRLKSNLPPPSEGPPTTATSYLPAQLFWSTVKVNTAPYTCFLLVFAVVGTMDETTSAVGRQPAVTSCADGSNLILNMVTSAQLEDYPPSSALSTTTRRNCSPASAFAAQARQEEYFPRPGQRTIACHQVPLHAITLNAITCAFTLSAITWPSLSYTAFQMGNCFDKPAGTDMTTVNPGSQEGAVADVANVEKTADAGKLAGADTPAEGGMETAGLGATAAGDVAAVKTTGVCGNKGEAKPATGCNC
eukprot:gene24844-10498_t